MAKWTLGDESSSETLIGDDHLYASHVNELRDSNPATVIVGTGSNAQFSDVNNAIAELPSDGGKVVIMEGTYTISSEIQVPDNVHIEGQGTGTILKAEAGSTGLTVIGNSDTSGGNTNIRISNLQIHMNRSNRTGAGNSDYGIYLKNVTQSRVDHVFVQETHWKAIRLENTTGCFIEDCTAKNCRDSGIELAGSTFGEIRGCYVNGITSDSGLAPDGIRISGDDLIVDNCIVEDTQYRAFAIEGAEANFSERCTIQNSKAYYYTDYGFFMNYNDNCSIIGCVARGKGDSAFNTTPAGGSPTGGGIGYRVATNCLIANNICELNWQNGINPGSDMTTDQHPYGNSIIGNICKNNNQAGGEGWGGIFVYKAGAGSTHNDTIVSDNICYDDQDTQTQIYGIRCDSEDNTVISGNLCYGNREDGIRVGGNYHTVTGNLCRDNGQVGTGNGINMSNAMYCTVVGNTCTGSSQNYGILSENTSDYNNVSGNILHGNGTGAISLVGSNNETSGGNIS